MTKEALEESLRLVGPKLDLKRRVSQYLEKVAEEDELEDYVDDGAHEEAAAPPGAVEPDVLVQEAIVVAPTPSSEAPTPTHAAPPPPAPNAKSRPAEEVRVVARKPLVSRNTQNQVSSPFQVPPLLTS